MLDVSCLLTVIPQGVDAKREFGRLAVMCGWGPVDAMSLEVATEAPLDAADRAVARFFNGEVKSVLWASCDGHDVEAFAGAALVPLGNPLATSRDDVRHVHVAGTYRAESNESFRRGPTSPRAVAAPVTEWLVRARFPGFAPPADAVSALFERAGLHTLTGGVDGSAHWRRVAATSRARVEAAITQLHTRHRVHLTAIRAL